MIIFGDHFEDFITSQIEAESLRQALIEGKENGDAGSLDFAEIKRTDRKKAKLTVGS